MPCLNEKLLAGFGGATLAAGGGALIVSTATGPAFFAACVAWLGACGTYGVALGKLAVCLATNGEVDLAAIVREKAEAIAREIEQFKTWGRSVGFDFP